MVVETYSTAAIAPPERVRHWLRIIAETYFPLTLTYRDPARFHGRVERRQAGPASLSRLRTGPASYERDIDQIRHCDSADYLITVPTTAPVAFRQLGREVSCAPDRFCATLFDGTSDMGGLFVETVRRTHAMGGSLADSDVLGRHLVELLALTLDRAAETEAGAATPIRAAHLKRAQDMIRANLHDPALGPEAVARACGISRRYLHEIFADTETTVAHFISRVRLAAARDFLALPGDLPLAQVAYRFGFGDQAQFARQFRAAFGQTPSGFRASRRAARAGEREGMVG